MRKAKIRRHAPYLGALLLILIAMLIRYADRTYDSAPEWLRLVHSGIYIGMIAAWGVSLHRRILQNQTRRYLGAIAGVMVLWLTLRTVKYSIHNIDVERYLWYFYYLPMLLIPAFSIAAAMSLGKPEDYRLPRWLGILYIPALVLLALVLTNDAHQLVFRFPEGMMSDREYSYGIGYYVVVGWEGICSVLALGLILYKCRIPHTNVFLSSLPAVRCFRSRTFIPFRKTPPSGKSPFLCFIGQTVCRSRTMRWNMPSAVERPLVSR